MSSISIQNLNNIETNNDNINNNNLFPCDVSSIHKLTNNDSELLNKSSYDVDGLNNGANVNYIREQLNLNGNAIKDFNLTTPINNNNNNRSYTIEVIGESNIAYYQQGKKIINIFNIFYI